MTRLARVLMGFGFLWICAWAVFGSLLGARINAALVTGDAAWIDGLQRTLFRTAHAHMNSMAMSLILMGLSFPHARRVAPLGQIRKAAWAALVSIPVFGLGLLLEAFHPPRPPAVSWHVGVSALGGGIYILAIGYWGALLVLGRKDTRW